MDGEGGWHRGEGAIELVKRNASEVGREGAMGGSSWEVLRMLFQTLLRDFQQVDTLSSYVLHVNFEDVLFFWICDFSEFLVWHISAWQPSSRQSLL